MPCSPYTSDICSFLTHKHTIPCKQNFNIFTFSLDVENRRDILDNGMKNGKTCISCSSYRSHMRIFPYLKSKGKAALWIPFFCIDVEGKKGCFIFTFRLICTNIRFGKASLLLFSVTTNHLPQKIFDFQGHEIIERCIQIIESNDIYIRGKINPIHENLQVGIKTIDADV